MLETIGMLVAIFLGLAFGVALGTMVILSLFAWIDANYDKIHEYWWKFQDKIRIRRN